MSWKYKNLSHKGNHSSRLEHRQVMEDYLGRNLSPEEHIHHIDGNKRNNKIENLYLVKNRREHYLLDKALGKYEKKSKWTKKRLYSEEVKLTIEEYARLPRRNIYLGARFDKVPDKYAQFNVV